MYNNNKNVINNNRQLDPGQYKNLKSGQFQYENRYLQSNNSTQQNSSHTERICNYCKKLGHLVRDCKIRPNNQLHEGTKCTPYELIFDKLGREPPSEPLSQQEKLQTYDDYLINFVTQLHEMRTQAKQNLISAGEKSEIY